MSIEYKGYYRNKYGKVLTDNKTELDETLSKLVPLVNTIDGSAILIEKNCFEHLMKNAENGGKKNATIKIEDIVIYGKTYPRYMYIEDINDWKVIKNPYIPPDY